MREMLGAGACIMKEITYHVCDTHGGHTGTTCPRCGNDSTIKTTPKTRPILFDSPRAKQNQDAVSFTIPLNPEPKQRPRFSPRSKTAYTPAKTRNYEAKVAQFTALHVTVPYAYPLFVHLKFYRKIQPGKKPDIDNLAKAVLDGMESIAYKNDDIVRKLYLEIEYVRENLRTEVYIAPVTATQQIAKRIAA